MSLIDSTIAEQFDRLPPHDLDAEVCALGSMMLSGDDAVFHEIRAMLARDAFYLADHQIIFDVLGKMKDAGQPVDGVLLMAELRKRQLLEEVGGHEYLAQILSSVPSAAHGAHYAKIVREKWDLRRLISSANETLRACYAPSHAADPAVEIASRSMGQQAEIVTNASAKYERIDAMLRRTYEQIEGGGVELVPTGFRDVDEQTGGVARGEMIVVAARPSMGKSTLGRQIAVNAARRNIPAGLISLEEGGAKVARNWFAAEASIENNRLRRGNLQPQDWGAMAKALTSLSGLAVYMTDRARRLQDVQAIASLWATRHGVKLIVVDYLQRVHADGRTPYERVSAASTGLSDLFKQTNTAGVVMAQLNRGVEGRDDKHPSMADLRDSGQIEQDADGIVFLHREDYYGASKPGYVRTGEAELIVAKWRDGVRGKVIKLRSELQYQRFADTEIVTAPIPEVF